MKVLPLSLLRIFLTQVVLTLVLSLTMNDANAQRRGGGQGGNQGGNGQSNHQQGGSLLNLNQYMQDKDKIVLSRQMNLAQADKLLIKAQSQSWDAKLILVLNQQKIETIQLSQYSSSKTVMLPQMQPSDKLVLKVKGTVFLQSVEAIKTNNQSPGNADTLVAKLYGQQTGATTLQVKKLINEQNGPASLKGKNVEKVILVASSRRGSAQATLLIDGRAVGYSQTIPQGKTRLVFNLPGRRNVIGNQINKIQIQIDGRAVTLNKVAVKIKQTAGHQGPGMNQAVTINVNRQFLGSQRMSLTQLIGRPRVDMNAPVKKLVIDVAGHGNIMVNATGGRIGSIIAAGRYGSAFETIHVDGSASINQMMLRISGRVTIKSVKVVFGY